MTYPVRFGSYIIEKFEIGSFGVNNYLIFNELTRNALLIDAGEDVNPVLLILKNKHLTLDYIIITHGHADHIHGAGELIEKTGAKLVIHQEDNPALSDPARNLSLYVGEAFIGPPADIILDHQQNFQWHDLELQIFHCPGHSPGSIALLAEQYLFAGDVLFNGSVGRTDFPFSNHQDLLNSIRKKLMVLPGETIVLPGHGPETTIENEKQHNPYI